MRKHTKCIVKYKLFSTFEEWLQKEPKSDQVINDTLIDTVDENVIYLNVLSAIGGQDKLLEELRLLEITLSTSVSNKNMKDKAISFYEVLPLLQELNNIFVKEALNRLKSVASASSAIKERYKIKNLNRK
jgi:hypothetical protein